MHPAWLSYMVMAALAEAQLVTFYTKNFTCPVDGTAGLDVSQWNQNNTVECRPSADSDFAANPCTYDPQVKRGYCCGFQESYCWTWAEKCKGSGDTAGIGQLGCDGFCCNRKEICTQAPNQTNICWLLPGANPMLNLSVEQSNATFLNLVRESPEAYLFTFDPSRAFATTSPTPSSLDPQVPTSASQQTQTLGSDPQASIPGESIDPANERQVELSTGGVAGIGAGWVLAVLFAALGAYAVGYRRARHAQFSSNTALNGMSQRHEGTGTTTSSTGQSRRSSQGMRKMVEPPMQEIAGYARHESAGQSIHEM